MRQETNRTSLLVQEHVPYGKSAYRLRLKSDMDFIPGQMVELSMHHHRTPRLYSIASAPGTGYIDIIYNVVPSGELTPFLRVVRPGDSLLVGRSRGEFVDLPERPAWWIANGTGVAPFLSMFRSGMRRGKTLIHGARSPEDFYGQEFFLRGGKGFSYIPCCSDDDAVSHCGASMAEHVRTGRLTRWLQAQELPSGMHYYLCGSEQMILQVRQILLEKGISFTRVISEIYF